MRHTMQISVSKKPKNSVAVVRRITGREKLMPRISGVGCQPKNGSYNST